MVLHQYLPELSIQQRREKARDYLRRSPRYHPEKQEAKPDKPGIVEILVDPSGTISNLRAEWIPFYTAIRDDYKNWQHGR